MKPKYHILKVAEDLFFKKGYHETTIRDIAFNADVNTSMINYYFKSKENLYIIIISKIEDLLCEVYMKNRVIESPKEKLTDFVKKTYIGAYQNKKAMSIFITEDWLPSSIKIEKAVKKIKDRHFAFFCSLIKDYSQKQEFHTINDEIILYHSVFGMMSEILKRGRSEAELSKSNESYIPDFEEIYRFLDNKLLLYIF